MYRMGDDACVKKGKRILLLLALTILLSTGQSLLSGWLVREVFLRKLPENPVETAAFRQLSVREENLGKNSHGDRACRVDDGRGIFS